MFLHRRKKEDWLSLLIMHLKMILYGQEGIIDRDWPLDHSTTCWKNIVNDISFS